MIQFVDKENNGFLCFFRITEIGLRANLYTILCAYEQEGCVGYVERSDNAAYEIVRTRAVDNVELLAQPFDVNYGREYRIAVLFFHGEIVTYGVTLFYGSAALYDARLKKHRLNQGCFTRSRCTQKGDVFNLR